MTTISRPAATDDKTNAWHWPTTTKNNGKHNKQKMEGGRGGERGGETNTQWVTKDGRGQKQNFSGATVGSGRNFWSRRSPSLNAAKDCLELCEDCIVPHSPSIICDESIAVEKRPSTQQNWRWQHRASKRAARKIQRKWQCDRTIASTNDWRSTTDLLHGMKSEEKEQSERRTKD